MLHAAPKERAVASSSGAASSSAERQTGGTGNQGAVSRIGGRTCRRRLHGRQLGSGGHHSHPGGRPPPPRERQPERWHSAWNQASSRAWNRCQTGATDRRGASEAGSRLQKSSVEARLGRHQGREWIPGWSAPGPVTAREASAGWALPRASDAPCFLKENRPEEPRSWVECAAVWAARAWTKQGCWPAAWRAEAWACSCLSGRRRPPEFQTRGPQRAMSRSFHTPGRVR